MSGQIFGFPTGKRSRR